MLACSELGCRINNCVGEDNHWLFLQLCFYAQVLSFFTLVLDFCQYYYFQPLTRLDQVFQHFCNSLMNFRDPL